MSTPDFMLNEEFVYHITAFDKHTFPKGIFVRPIKLSYVPKHVLDRVVYEHFDKVRDVYCYTTLGIFPLPRKLITQVAGSRALDIYSYN